LQPELHRFISYDSRCNLIIDFGVLAIRGGELLPKSDVLNVDIIRNILYDPGGQLLCVFYVHLYK